MTATGSPQSSPRAALSSGAGPGIGTGTGPGEGPDAGPQGRTRPWPALADRRGAVRPEVSVVVPTYNEVENLPVLLDRLELTLAHLDHEIVVVDDDSPDGTWQVAEARADRSPRLRVVRRIGRRGLSSAVLEGMAVARGRVLAVIDADLQHDESILPAMVEAVTIGGADVCIGSRSGPGGSYGQFGPARRAVSWAGAQLARSVLGVDVTDPMSGFFALSRDRYETIRPALTGRGFKLLLEMVALGPRPRVAEVGYCFRARTAGSTKLSSGVAAQYLAEVAELALSRLAATGFLTYGPLALLAVAVRVALWSVTERTLGPSPLWLALGAEAALIIEFGLHNRCTFASRGHRGWGQVGPLLRFHLVSLYGLLTLAGLGALVVDRLPGPGPGGSGVAATAGLLAVSALGLMGSVVVGFLLNTRVTWPSR